MSDLSLSRFNEIQIITHLLFTRNNAVTLYLVSKSQDSFQWRQKHGVSLQQLLDTPGLLVAVGLGRVRLLSLLVAGGGGSSAPREVVSCCCCVSTALPGSVKRRVVEAVCAVAL